jgi:hypothetical protein
VDFKKLKVGESVVANTQQMIKDLNELELCVDRIPILKNKMRQNSHAWGDLPEACAKQWQTIAEKIRNL